MENTKSFAPSEMPFAVIISIFVVIGIANGEFLLISKSIEENGVLGAILATFDISLVQFIAAFVACDLLSKSKLFILNALDNLVLCTCAILVLLPISGLSWLSMTIFSLYLIGSPRFDEFARRAGWVLLGLSYTSLWSKLIFKYFLDYILFFDTKLISLVTGVQSQGNLIYGADGKTTLQVLEGCSAFGNISLALLGWLIARSYFNTRGMKRGFLFISLSIIAVVAINTLRIGVIALRPDFYDIAHGPIGANLANIATSASIAFISYRGALK